MKHEDLLDRHVALERRSRLELEREEEEAIEREFRKERMKIRRVGEEEEEVRKVLYTCSIVYTQQHSSCYTCTYMLCVYPLLFPCHLLTCVYIVPVPPANLCVYCPHATC